MIYYGIIIRMANLTKRKINKINKLAEKALKDKPIWEPSNGYRYLKDLEKGSIFQIGDSMKGIYLDSTPTSAKVIILSCDCSEEDKSYYLGKQNISNETEVL